MATTTNNILTLLIFFAQPQGDIALRGMDDMMGGMGGMGIWKT
jgi:hypothetical protein